MLGDVLEQRFFDLLVVDDQVVLGVDRVPAFDQLALTGVAPRLGLLRRVGEDVGVGAALLGILLVGFENLEALDDRLDTALPVLEVELGHAEDDPEGGVGFFDRVDLGADDDKASCPCVPVAAAAAAHVDPVVRTVLLTGHLELGDVLPDILRAHGEVLRDVRPKVFGLVLEHAAVARNAAPERLHRVGRILDPVLQEAQDQHVRQVAALDPGCGPLPDDRDLLELGRNLIPLRGGRDLETVRFVLVPLAEAERAIRWPGRR
ncbi:MAG: hypothetical protein ACYS0F_11765 [Planctomycetota bacterium]